MKYTKIRLAGPTNIDLPLKGLDPLGPFVLKSADGLGPTPVDVFIEDTMFAGGVFQNARPRNRDSTLTVGLQPSWDTGQTSEDLRTMLYSLMTPWFGNFIKMQIMDGDTVLAEAEGRVRSLEPNLFSKDPEVVIDLGFITPYFWSPGIFGQYQQPALTRDASYTYFTLNNPGTAPVGVVLNMVLPVAHNYSLQLFPESLTYGYMTISHNFAAGDMVQIDTRDATRNVSVTPNGGSAVSIVDDLGASSPWLQLHPGDNPMKINDPNMTWPALFPAVIKPAYLGV